MKKCFIIIIACVCAAAANGQDAKLFSAQKSHTFSWQAASDASYYEIVIERQDNDGTYRSFRTETSTQTTMELMFGPGLYRSRLIVHDFLGMASEPSQWLYFEIKPSMPAAPTIAEEPPLVPEEAAPEETAAESAPGTQDGTPAEETASETAEEETPEPEPEPEISNTAIYSNNMFINVSFAALPIIPAYGMSDIGEMAAFQPISFAMRAGASVKYSELFNFGFEVEPSLARLDYYVTSSPAKRTAMGINVINLNTNLAAQWLLSAKRFAVNLRAGCGITFLQNTSGDNGAAPAFNPMWAVNAGAGFSFAYYAAEHIAIDAGLAYRHIFIPDRPVGYLTPMLGLLFRI